MTDYYCNVMILKGKQIIGILLLLLKIWMVSKQCEDDLPIPAGVFLVQKYVSISLSFSHTRYPSF